MQDTLKEPGQYENYLLCKFQLLSDNKYLESNTPYSGSLYFVLGTIQFKLLYVCKSVHAQCVKEADSLFAKAKECFEAAGAQRYDNQLHKIAINRFGLVFNASAPGERTKDLQIKNFVEEIKIVHACKALLRENNWWWSIAWNGIQVAEILQDEELAIEFYEALRKSHEAFEDKSYRPTGTLGSLDNNPDFKWFKSVILPLYSN